jgi:hypothetical protein
VNEIADLANGSSDSTDDSGCCPSNEEAQSRNRGERQFDQVVERLIYVATANNMLPSDAFAALAKALGTLVAFTARREGHNKDALLRAVQDTVSDYMTAAGIYMNKNSDSIHGTGTIWPIESPTRVPVEAAQD